MNPDLKFCPLNKFFGKNFNFLHHMRYFVSTVMTKSQAEQFILSLTNVGRKEYLANRKDCAIYLKRLQFFLDLLGNPEKKIPHYIHVTGTSGKGSVCLMLDSILRASGKKVGVLTSPHASIIQERWEVDGKLMSGKDFAEVVTEIKPKFDEYIRKSPYDMISYYETMTAIALYYFAKKKVEWAVLEVGCGGRYDATNVIPRKDVAVITNIGLDHMELLGNTKEKIAHEKAGIIKPGCGVFTAEKDRKVLRVIEKECKKNKVRLEISNSKFLISNKISNIQYPISHKHQLTNAQLCFSIAKHLQIPDKAIIAGLKRVKLPLRMEIVSRKPLIILDGAHNPDKMRTTVATLKHKNIKASKQHYNITTLQHYNNIHLIVGFSDNKDIRTMIRQLSTLRPTSVACTRQTQNPFRKAANPREIADQFKRLLPTCKIEMFLDPKDALGWSLKQNRANGAILATGSIFLSGEIKNLFIKQSSTLSS